MCVARARSRAYASTASDAAIAEQLEQYKLSACASPTSRPVIKLGPSTWRAAY